MDSGFKNITRQNVQDILPLTPLQEGMLFHYLKNPEDRFYYEQLALNLTGNISVELITKAWENVITANEMLRTVYRWEKLAKPVQTILKTVEVPLRIYDFRALPLMEQAAKAAEVKRQDRAERIDLSTEPYRITLMLLAENEVWMLVSNHHILYDGWSNGVILKEFFQAYTALAAGNIPPRMQKNTFKEFVKWLQTQEKTQPISYWTAHLADFDSKTLLPQITTRIVGQTEVEDLVYHLASDLANCLNSFAKENRITQAAVFYTVWGLLLHKYTNTDDVLFGTPVSGRNGQIAGIEEMVGLFINTIPLRIKVTGEESVLALCKSVNQLLKERTAYENVPLPEIKACSSIAREENLFDSVVVIENYPLDKELNEKNYALQVKSYEMHEMTNFDLTLAVEFEGQIKLRLSYNKAKFTQDMMQRLFGHYRNLLTELLSKPEVRPADLEMLTVAEKNQILKFNQTSAEYPGEKTLHQLFSEQAALNPERIAVIFGEQQLTYGELNVRTNQLARTLQEKGVKQDSIVGLSLTRSLEMMIGIFGILKAGGAYLPIDPTYPPERIQFMLSDSSAKILLTDSKWAGQLDCSLELLILDTEAPYASVGTDLPSISSSHNLAYIIYTSGSTGKPKGVMIEHHSVLNRLNWMKVRYPAVEQDTILQKTPFTFDVSVWELFWWTIVGAKLCFLTPGGEKDPETIVHTVEKYQITLIHFVPSMLQIFLDFIARDFDLGRVKSLRQVFASGEALTRQQVLKFNQYLHRANGTTLHNLYGPTEATVEVAYFDCLPDGDLSIIPIGKPIDNTQLFIYDRNWQLQPVGIPGELCIAGVNLARGYLQRPELTAEKFVTLPGGVRIYRTGDLARWLPDGNIEYLGRIDQQVKIRGYRIELGEIENQLLNHPEIAEAVVVDRADTDGQRYLCAYFVSSQELTLAQLREFLLKSLPEYMVPAYFMKIEKMPLNANGKINRQALPAPKASFTPGTEYQAPRSEIEAKLAEIWCEVLNLEKVGINDRFFDIGGHSLKATVLVAKIHKVLEIEVPLREVFAAPTIKGLGAYIAKKNRTGLYSIEKAADKEYYQTSSAQRRIYLLQQFQPESIGYNMVKVLHIDGKLDVAKVENVFQRLISRHEILRTSFFPQGEQIMQRVLPEVEFKVEYLKEAEENLTRPFDLQQAPLFRLGVKQIGVDQHLLIFAMHHIISDGTSVGILLDEFSALYSGQELAENRLQYRDYAEWQNHLITTDSLKEQEAYWLTQFGDEIPVLNLPTDFLRPTVQSYEGGQVLITLEKDLTRAIQSIVHQTGTTLYMVFLAAVNILCAKYSSQTDIVIGSPIAGRGHADLQQLIGIFINTLALRNKPVGDKTYGEFLAEVKANALKAYENQDYQFEDLVERLNLRGDLNRNPLFDVMFVMQNMPAGTLNLPDVKITDLNYQSGTAKFDLTIVASEAAEEISLNFEYSTRLFKRETIERMAVHFRNILRVAAADLEIELQDIEMLPAEEKEQILHTFNHTSAPYPQHQTLSGYFEEQVRKTPDNLAVVYGGESLTYQELNQRANQVARTLRAKGVKADTVVGIIVGRSLEMIVGLLAILKAGGAYLPIDPGYPEGRIEYLLTETKVEILLIGPDANHPAAFSGMVCDLREASLYAGDASNLVPVSTSHHLAYIIYTSGSTGKPKGVMIEHQAILNNLAWRANYYGLEASDAVLQMFSFAFDGSVATIFTPLIVGAKLVLISEADRLNLAYLRRCIVEERITALLMIPGLYLTLLEENPAGLENLRLVIVAGESFPAKLMQEHFKKLPTVKLYNEYGPTENSVCSTVFALTSEGEVLIGKPISNVQCYILDSAQKLQPIGVPGELCVGGVGLARGYLNKPELTAEKFIQNPYKSGERMYRTGDLARYRKDGTIEFCGRIDQQVKIRGYRIELGEIENILLSYPGVKEVVVIDRTDAGGTKSLSAYLVLDEKLTVHELREYLARNLPTYMIPADFIQLAQLPVNASGKIDRKALPAPESSSTLARDYTAPENAIQAKLLHIWRDVLKVEKIGIDDGFFELGGQSLKASVLAGRIQREFAVEIPLKELFQRQTIRGISQYIQNAANSVYTAIGKIGKRDYYTATPAQKRVYLLTELDGESTKYNMPGFLQISGSLSLEKVEQVFRELMNRHEILRTAFAPFEGNIIQRVEENAELKIEYLETGGLSTIEALVAEFIRPFDLSQAPLFRVKVAKIDESDYILMLDMHHIISDGTSMGILISEFISLYEGKELSNLRLQYKDYAEWQNALLTSPVLEKQKEYWLNALSGELPVLNLPTDYPRPTVQSYAGDSHSFALTREQTQVLLQTAADTGCTLYMLLLAGLNILLARYSGQEDIIIGTPIAGRPHPDLENVLGMFVNTLALRNLPAQDKTCRDFIEEVRENTLQAYANQDYQFEELVDQLNLKRDLSRNPLFDVNLNLFDVNLREISLAGMLMRPLQVKLWQSKFDLTLAVQNNPQGLQMEFLYCTKLFKPQTIARMAGHLTRILEVMAGEIDVKLGELDFLSIAEKTELLDTFNATDAWYPEEKTLHLLFEEQAAKRPGDIALIYQEREVTYNELNLQANQLARVLRANGVARDTIVAIMVERSVEMMVGILAILKAGGAYLPLLPNYPLKRVAGILADSEAKLLLALPKCITEVEEAADFAIKTVDLSCPTNYSSDGSNLPLINKPTDLAYVLYTSGSTGKPKGVLLCHQAVVATLTHLQQNYPLASTDAILQCTTYVFDASVREIFWWFFNGAKCCLLGPDEEKDPGQIVATIARRKITHVKFVPVLLNEVLSAIKKLGPDQIISLKYVFVGGEALSAELVTKFQEIIPAQTGFINLYGPTETTMHSTEYVLRTKVSGSFAPIGHPISNEKVYILDQRKNLVPTGVCGEIYIGGIGVGRGYLNNPALTLERFIENPFRPGERMYKTGDLGRWLADGNIEYLGRIDQQVKIRGFRIEPGEIENQLRKYPGLGETAVVDRTDSRGLRFLCAYFTGERSLSIPDLRKFLQAVLPEYMIPAHFVQLEVLPLTTSGKIDRRALPEPVGVRGNTEYTPPGNAIEEKLIAIWQELLGVSPISITDNFFELGGHSFKVITLSSLVNQEWQIELPLRTVFKMPTVKELAEYIADSVQITRAKLKPVEKQEYYPVSPAQKRFYVLHQLEDVKTAYNMPHLLLVQGELDFAQLASAFQTMVERHEILRTSFAMRKGEPVQVVHENLQVQMPHLRLSEEELERVVQGLIEPFDLSRAPIMRAALLETPARKILFFDSNHILLDGVSVDVFIHELSQIYAGEELPVPVVHYKDYVIYQEAALSLGQMCEQENYWLNALQGPLPELDFPTDYPRPEMEDFQGDYVIVSFDADLSREIQQFVLQQQVTVYVFLLAVYNILLARYTSQEDMLVGTVTAGRVHADVAKTPGLFINTLPMRTHPKAAKQFNTYLQEVQETVLGVYENQDYPFELLVKNLGLHWAPGKNPLLRTLFFAPIFGNSVITTEGFTLTPLVVEKPTARFDILAFLSDNLAEISVTLEYKTALFKRTTIEKMRDHYGEIVKQVLAHPEMALQEIVLSNQIKLAEKVVLDDGDFGF